MKSIAEVAKIMRVTPQAVYKVIKDNSIEGLSDHVSKNEKGVTVVDTTGVKLINNHFKPNEQQKHGGSDLNGELIAMLKTELEAKNKQIEQLGQSLFNAQILLKNEQERTMLLESKTDIKEAEEPSEPQEAQKGFKGALKRFFGIIDT
jgi:hypothetical protein